MAGETSADSPKPSLGEKVTLSINLLWAGVLHIDDSCFPDVECYYAVPLSGDESNQNQHISIDKDSNTDLSMGLTLVLCINDTSAFFCWLKFKIKKAERTSCSIKDVGDVDVPVMDLLQNSGVGHEKPKMLSYDVKSPSGENKGVLKFYCKLVPPSAKKPSEPCTGFPTPTAPPASNSAVVYPLPMSREVLPPSPYPPAAPEAYPPAGYLSSGGYPPASMPPHGYGYPPTGMPPHGYGYLSSGGYPPAGIPSASMPSHGYGYPPPAGYLLTGMPPHGHGYPLPGGYPPSMPPHGYGYPLPGGYPPTGMPPHGYSLSAGYGHTGPPPPANESTWMKLLRGTFITTASNMVGSWYNDFQMSLEA